MANGLFSFGSHTHTHSILSTLSPAETHFELNKSQKIIEQMLGTSCTLFSYPNGRQCDFRKRDHELLEKLGYKVAVSQIDGFNDSKTDIFALRRINITRNDDFNYFLAKITGVWSLLKTVFRNL